ncbi:MULTISPECIES: hypothetical protein [Streptomyces]|uniref:C2H2-type domain-containing protein n=1 Tax=Streptomyces violaceusniger TaxID=68280 RepID=A0A4D4L4F1_STRVO|nr:MULTISPECIES: hypothetical protein [unclassified Streptomyces]MBD3006734.1 hypothetical protein [Streptomyces sp. 5-10]GDY56022.1 hypothetical protein SVIO_066450 [Streptomyces violaceusniger]
MSDIAGTSSGAHPIAAHTPSGQSGEVAHEAYAFACMKCGHGWERAYDIEHHVDGEGRAFVVYFTDGRRVPSPLTSPDCVNCGAHLVRIMRSGQVSSVLESARRGRPHTTRDREDGTGAPDTEADAAPDRAPENEGPARRRGHHWHLPNLLHPFQHHRD